MLNALGFDDDILYETRQALEMLPRKFSGPHMLREAAKTKALRTKLAASSHVPQTKAKYRLTKSHEADLAETLRGSTSNNQNEPFDVYAGKHAIEVKTINESGHDRITMHPSSLKTKLKAAKKGGLTPHTVVFDTRKGKEAVYYREGLGSFRLAQMKKLPGIEAIREALGIMDDHIQESGLEEVIHKTGSGYQVRSEKGKNLSGKNLSKGQAKKRLAQVEYFKHQEGGPGSGPQSKLELQKRARDRAEQIRNARLKTKKESGMEEHGVKGMKWGVRKDHKKGQGRTLSQMKGKSAGKNTAKGKLQAFGKAVKNTHDVKTLKTMGRKLLDFIEHIGNKVGPYSTVKEILETAAITVYGAMKIGHGDTIQHAIMWAHSTILPLMDTINTTGALNHLHASGLREAGVKKGFKESLVKMHQYMAEADITYGSLKEAGVKGMKWGVKKDSPSVTIMVGTNGAGKTTLLKNFVQRYGGHHTELNGQTVTEVTKKGATALIMGQYAHPTFLAGQAQDDNGRPTYKNSGKLRKAGTLWDTLDAGLQQAKEKNIKSMILDSHQFAYGKGHDEVLEYCKSRHIPVQCVRIKAPTEVIVARVAARIDPGHIRDRTLQDISSQNAKIKGRYNDLKGWKRLKLNNGEHTSVNMLAGKMGKFIFKGKTSDRSADDRHIGESLKESRRLLPLAEGGPGSGPHITLYHGTSIENAKSILKHGFDTKRNITKKNPEDAKTISFSTHRNISGGTYGGIDSVKWIRGKPSIVKGGGSGAIVTIRAPENLLKKMWSKGEEDLEDEGEYQTRGKTFPKEFIQSVTIYNRGKKSTLYPVRESLKEGGKGSGDKGHKGRKGEVGGSGAGGDKTVKIKKLKRGALLHVMGETAVLENPKLRYGYLKGHRSTDHGDLDVFLGKNFNKGKDVWVFYTKKDLGNRTIVEPKCMIGFDSKKDAVKAFSKKYDKGRILFNSYFTSDDFKDALKTDELYYPPEADKHRKGFRDSEPKSRPNLREHGGDGTILHPLDSGEYIPMLASVVGGEVHERNPQAAV